MNRTYLCCLSRFGSVNDHEYVRHGRLKACIVTVVLELSRCSQASSEPKDENVTMIMSRLISASFAVGTALRRHGASRALKLL